MRHARYALKYLVTGYSCACSLQQVLTMLWCLGVGVQDSGMEAMLRAAQHAHDDASI
jgi:hypothetical protein